MKVNLSKSTMESLTHGEDHSYKSVHPSPQKQEENQSTSTELSINQCYSSNEDIQSLSSKNDFYRVHSSILHNSGLSLVHRAKIKSWLILELTKHQFCRQTYAFASKYLDLFILKKHYVGLDSLQTLGLSCFVLASKLVEGRIPPISFSAFSKSKISQFQKQICFSLKFKLNPPTYVSIAQILMHSWDQFVKNGDQPFKNQYFTQNKISLINFHSVMEILDCIDLNVRSLDFDIPSLVLCVFFLENRKNCLNRNHPSNMKEVNGSQLKKYKVLSQRDEYRRVWNNFVEKLNEAHPQFLEAILSKEIFKFILPFLSLKTRREKFIPENLPSFRYYMALQSYHEDAYGLAKKTFKL